MAELFLKVVNLSFSASFLALAVIAVRLLLKKAPKWVNVLLWGLVAFRLVCPFSVESAMSLIPSAEVVSPEIMMDVTPEIQTGIEAVNSAVNPVITQTFTPDPAASANPLQIWIPILAVVWIIGMAAMGEYTLFTWLRLRRNVATAIRVNENVYLSDSIPSPFVLGVFRPKIYLPYGMTEQDMYHVIAHERTHIRRRDHWWKPLGFGLLTVHWFNPVLWIAYILLCRDIELACDEKVIKELGMEQRADYSQALLNCSISHRSIAACPIAFGEVGVKERVRNVLRYKKPAFWVIVIALVLCIIVAVCFLTDPAPALIDRIINQDGYRILFQTEMELEMSIRKQDYPEDCYTLEGHSFRQGEYVSGSSFGNMYYLTHMGYADETGEYLRFTFDIFYEPTGSTVFVPYQVLTQDGSTVGKESSLSVRNNQIFADEGGFDLACYSGWVESSQKFYVDIRRDVWDYARTGVYFTIDGFRRITFVKEPLFGEVNPRPITHSLIVEDIDFAQATFWGDSTSHLELSKEQIGELVHILYQLPPDDFEPSTFPIHTISLMVSCGGREMLLSTNGSYVYFTFDSETAANLDGDWMTADEDLIKFLTGLSAYADADSFYGVSLMIEEVTPNGATVVFTGEGEKPEGRLMGGNDYWLQVESDGQWTDVTKVPEPSFTTNAYDIDNVRRHKIDWQWRYGTLPSGHYRIGKSVTYQEGSKPLENATVWAEFMLDNDTADAYAILANLIPDGARAESTFASGGGYNCFPDEAEALVQILNGIEESELVTFPAVTPIISLTLYANEQVTLHYNGVYVQFGFHTGESEIPWAVKNEKLNAFFEKLNSHSPENSTYEIYNVAPLEDLPETYSIEEATIDKVVIMVDGDVSANQDVWNEFVTASTSGIPATVRVMHYDFPSQETPGNKIIYDLEYDGTGYRLTHCFNGFREVFDYAYLRYFAGELGEDGGFQDSFECYVLTDNATDPWDKLSRSYGNQLTIYQNLIYVPKQMGLPWTETVELRLSGQTILTLSGSENTIDLHHLLRKATYLGYEPKTHFLGPELVLISDYGTSYTIQLDLDSDLVLYNGYFYDYGPGTNSNGGINNLPVLLGMLGLEDWPEEVKQTYPDYFGETNGVSVPPANTLFPSDDQWSKAYISLWFTDGAQLGFGDPQTLPILETLYYEAPNPTDQEMPGFADCVFSANIAFSDNGPQYNIGCVGQAEFYLQRAGSGEVYTFSSDALRQAFESAISEVQNDESSIFYAE